MITFSENFIQISPGQQTFAPASNFPKQLFTILTPTSCSELLQISSAPSIPAAWDLRKFHREELHLLVHRTMLRLLLLLSSYFVQNYPIFTLCTTTRHTIEPHGKRAPTHHSPLMYRQLGNNHDENESSGTASGRKFLKHLQAALINFIKGFCIL